MPNSIQEQNRTDYYYVQGQRVALETDDSIFAVRFRQGRRSDDPGLSVRSRRLLTEDAEALSFIPQYNLHIYRAAPGVRETPAVAGVERTLRDAVAALDEESSIEFAAMAVRRMGGTGNYSFLTRRFLVAFKPEVSQEQIDELIRDSGASIINPLGYVQKGYLLEAPDAEGERGPVALANRFYESGLCEFAHPDFIERRHWRVAASPPATERRTTASSQRREVTSRDGEFLDRQWHLRTAKVIDAWAVTRGSSSISICVMDDGVDTSHGEFQGRIGPQFDFQTHTADGSPKVSDDKHGTACAGVATAAGVRAAGVAPQCRLMPVRTPAFLGVSDEADMFRWAADNGADVISCSWGPPDNAGPFSLVDNVRTAIRYCVTQGRNGLGIPIFFAAGNGGELVSNDGYASNPEVMAIAASSARDTQAPYSDFGPEIFIAAPSSGDSIAGDPRIFTTDRRGTQGYNPGDSSLGDPAGDYTARFGGTSSACPLVAGTAALILSLNPSLTRDQVREILKDTAEKVGGVTYDAQGHSAEFGYGRVNVLAAVQAVSGGGGGSSGTPGIPEIQGPATASATQPPVFNVTLGGRRLYAVELATSRELLDPENASERTAANHFAGWSEGLISTPTYQPPAGVWSALAASPRVYFIGHFADDTSWSNYVASSSIEAAPSIEISGAGGGGVPTGGQTPSVQAPATVASGEVPQFQVQLGDRRMYAIELATSAELLDPDNRGLQTEANHYGSWVEGLRSNSPYVPPSATWARLAAAGRVYYIGHFANDNAWSNHTAVGDLNNPPSILVQASGDAGTGGTETGGQTGGNQPVSEVRYPSGAVFAAVTATADSIDYSDPAAGGVIPLIDTRGRENERLSSNFQLSELMARGARYARVSPVLVEALQSTRTRLGKALKVESGYRHPALNQAVHGDPQSEHMSGRAATVSGTSTSVRPIDIAKAALESVTEDFTIGLGPRSVHIEVAGVFSTFVYDGASMSAEEFAEWARGIRGTSRSVRRSVEMLEVSERGRPVIEGPHRVSRSGPAPDFSIQAGLNSYYAIEVASHPALFHSAADRRPGFFYASWSDPRCHLLEAPAGRSTVFVLPDDAWAQLRQHPALYYRLLTTADRTGDWSNLMASVTDDRAEEAPRIQIVDRLERRVRGLSRDAFEPAFLRSPAWDAAQWDD